jgi:hypothetical protein
MIADGATIRRPPPPSPRRSNSRRDNPFKSSSSQRPTSAASGPAPRSSTHPALRSQAAYVGGARPRRSATIEVTYHCPWRAPAKYSSTMSAKHHVSQETAAVRHLNRDRGRSGCARARGLCHGGRRHRHHRGTPRGDAPIQGPMCRAGRCKGSARPARGQGSEKVVSGSRTSSLPSIE